jgi:hypothetical protein
MKYNYQFDPSISEVLNHQKYQEEVSLPLENPINILSQQKSNITTNPYIKVGNTKNEETIQLNINANANNTNNPKFSEINQNLSSNVLGFFDDLFVKPPDETWNDYIPMILAKDDRYNYIGVFLLLVAFFILLVK